MIKFYSIESWASNLGYVVQKEDSVVGDKYFWHKERDTEFRSCHAVGELIEAILDEIRRSYEGEK